MKKLALSLAVTLLSLGGLAGTAAAAGYYQSVYCYPTGSYWVAQRNAYPDYYAANNAYYLAAYGPGTYYCK